MIDEIILNYILLFVFLEVYEVSWQKAPTMMEMLFRMNIYYKKNIVLFLIMQPTFYFSIGFVMLTNSNPYALLLLLIKTFDVALKIVMIEQVFKKKTLTKELINILLTPIGKYLPYIGLTIYPFLIALSFN